MQYIPKDGIMHSLMLMGWRLGFFFRYVYIPGSHIVETSCIQVSHATEAGQFQDMISRQEQEQLSSVKKQLLN